MLERGRLYYIGEGGAEEAPGLERLPNGTAFLHRGLLIAPRPGRVVIFSGGAPLSQESHQFLRACLGCPVLQVRGIGWAFRPQISIKI